MHFFTDWGRGVVRTSNSVKWSVSATSAICWWIHTSHAYDKLKSYWLSLVCKRRIYWFRHSHWPRIKMSESACINICIAKTNCLSELHHARQSNQIKNRKQVFCNFNLSNRQMTVQSVFIRLVIIIFRGNSSFILWICVFF